MSTEYSVEEVRARLAKLHDFINGKCANDEAGWKCVGFIFQHGEQLLNILAERIEADEMAADYPECSGDPASCPENEGFGCCKAHAEAITLHPPAQAAQPEPADAVSDEGDQLTVLIEHLTKVVEARHARGVPKLDAEDWAVLQRLRNALPDVGLNGWHRGVTVLSKLLAAAPSPGESE